MSTAPKIDGRYEASARELKLFMSGQALAKQSIRVEIDWLLALINESVISVTLTTDEIQQLKKLYETFSDEDFLALEQAEQTIKHDVRALAAYIQQKLSPELSAKVGPYIHYTLTSEDINNVAYALMFDSGCCRPGH